MRAVPAMLRRFLVVLAVAAAAPATAGAATINVTTESDFTRNDGACSLREAISAANQDAKSGTAVGECVAGNGADTVAVPAGVYVIASSPPNGPGDFLDNQFGDFAIESTITIQGAGAAETTIDGGGKDRVFFVSSGGTAVFSDVTISGGRTGSGCFCWLIE